MRLSIIIICLLVFSCHSLNDKQNTVRLFEDALGKEMTIAFNKAVTVLDSLVVGYTQIQNIDSAYLVFMNEVKINSINWNHFYSNPSQIEHVKSLIYSSGLYDELVLTRNHIYLNKEEWVLECEYFYQPKGAEFSKDTIQIGRLINRPIIQKMHSGDKVQNRKIIDSLVTEINNEIKYYNQNILMRSLTMVKDSHSVLPVYLDAKKGTYLIHSNLIAGGLLDAQADFSDYFVKRILALEFVIHRMCSSIYYEKKPYNTSYDY